MVLWGPTPDTASTEIYRSTDYTAGFHATFTKSDFPSDFPGYFRVCARNTATVPAQVTLSQNGY